MWKKKFSENNVKSSLLCQEIVKDKVSLLARAIVFKAKIWRVTLN